MNFDANANITSETGWTYIYDLSNQLIRVMQDTIKVVREIGVVAWEKVPSLSSATDTVIYILYGAMELRAALDR